LPSRRPSPTPPARAQKEAKKGDGRSGGAGHESAAPLGPGTAALFDFSAYGKFCSLIGGADTTRPKERPLAWLMRLIEEIYDSRYAKDTAELKEGEEGGGGGGGGGSGQTPFPTFVVEFFTKRYGLRSLIDSTCWDLLYNTHRLRGEGGVDVEVFGRFLEEMYDPDDLLFFLYVRSVAAKELNYSFRARWSEMGRSAAPSSPLRGEGTHGREGQAAGASLLLSFRDAAAVSRVVFGSEADPLYKTFMAMIERNMAGKKGGGKGGDGRTIDVAKFLHLAVVEYHETRPAEEGGAGGAGCSGAEGDRLYREAAAAYDDRLRSGALGTPGGGGGGGAASSSPAGSLAGGPRPSPALLEALGECMHRANEGYLDRVVALAGGLPKEVQAQIRTEVQAQLESKVDNVLAAVITVSQSGGGSSSGSGEVDGLASRFAAMVALGGSDEAVQAFCDAVLGSGEVKKTIEPLVNLLVQYATSRLKEATGGK
jgi:hypothetical protein